MSRGDVTDLDRYIGSRVREARKTREIGSDQLAEAIGYSEKQLSRYEFGKNKLSAAQIYKIGLLLGLPISWFFEGYSGEETPSQFLAGDGIKEYERTVVKEQLQAIESVWPRLPQNQRDAFLKLLDSYQQQPN